MTLVAALALAMTVGTRVTRAQLLDRVVASVGNHAITERDVTTECRFESFLKGKMPLEDYDLKTRIAARDRLISQLLLGQQMAEASTPSPSGIQNGQSALDEARKQFSTRKEYDEAAQKLGMTETQILDRLENYQRLLGMIDERFRPQATPSEEEIARYYHETFQPEFQKEQGRSAPALPEVEGSIREILVQQQINKLLQDWLDQMKQAEQIWINPNQ